MVTLSEVLNLQTDVYIKQIVDINDFKIFANEKIGFDDKRVISGEFTPTPRG